MYLLNFSDISSLVLPLSASIIPQIRNIKNEIKNTPNKIPAGIQNGDVTHHQDQSIFPVSFNTKNTMNNTPGSPIPFDVLFFILCFFIKLLNFF